MLTKLELSTKYTLAYKLKKRYKKEGEKEGIKKGKEEGMNLKALEMAKSMKQEGMDIGMIVRITGLTEEEIKKLKL